jgi:hypothetical protein
MARDRKLLVLGGAAVGVLGLATCCCLGSVAAYFTAPDPGNEPPEEVRAAYEEHEEVLRRAAGTTGCGAVSRIITSGFLGTQSAVARARRNCFGAHPPEYTVRGPAAFCRATGENGQPHDGVRGGDAWYPERVSSDPRSSSQNYVYWSLLPDGSYCIELTVAGFVAELAPDAHEELWVTLRTPARD